MNTNYECPNCGYIMGPKENECKYCGTKNPNYVPSNREVFMSKMGASTSDTSSHGTVKETSGKSRLVAGILQIVLPGLGIGRFYAGYTGIGIAQLLLSFFGCGVGSIWGFIDGILILCNQNFTDGSGKVMK